MLPGGAVLASRRVVAGEPATFHPEAISRTPPRVRLPALVGSMLAFTVYGWLLRNAPLPLVATYAYVNPVVAVVLGSVFLDEPIEPRTIVAGGDHRRRGRDHRHRARPIAPRAEPAPAASATGRRGSASCRMPPRPVRLVPTPPSASTVRATPAAIAMIAIIGLTPIPVGKSEPSAT